MNQQKMLYAVYEDGDTLIHAVEKTRSHGIHVVDCYTPYPVHGLDEAMGIKRSRLPIAAFVFAMIGLSCAISLQLFTMGIDWPMIIGGKPYIGVPSWIPVMFELSILFTAYGMGITFFIKSRMLHGMDADLVDIRQTDNRLIMALNVSDSENTTALETLLQETGVSEIKWSSPNVNELATSVKPKVANDASKVDEVKTKKSKSKPETQLSEEVKAQKIDLLLSKIGKSEDAASDDLKMINEVGIEFEKNLNSLGINTFLQISKMDSASIKLLEEVTKYFPGKIEREDWVSQAKNLINS